MKSTWISRQKGSKRLPNMRSISDPSRVVLLRLLLVLVPVFEVLLEPQKHLFQLMNMGNLYDYSFTFLLLSF